MEDEFKKIVASVLNADTEVLSEDTGMDNFNQWDSVAHWEIISAVEEEHDIEYTIMKQQN